MDAGCFRPDCRKGGQISAASVCLLYDQYSEHFPLLQFLLPVIAGTQVVKYLFGCQPDERMGSVMKG